MLPLTPLMHSTNTAKRLWTSVSWLRCIRPGSSRQPTN